MLSLSLSLLRVLLIGVHGSRILCLDGCGRRFEKVGMLLGEGGSIGVLEATSSAIVVKKVIVCKDKETKLGLRNMK